MLAREPARTPSNAVIDRPRVAAGDHACEAAAAPSAPALVRDPLGARLARAVAVRGYTGGPMLQRDAASAAKAMFDLGMTRVSIAELTQWLNKTTGEARNKKKNSALHGVSASDLKAIQAALAVLVSNAAEAAKAKAALEAAAKAEAESSDEEDGSVSFPHKGKHAPRPALLNRPKELAAATAGKGDVALYKTNDPYTVRAWEDEAREYGLTLKDGFTILYGFTESVGADHGELTRFVRIDGDHGHPIIESMSTLNTAFDSYMAKEVRESKNDVARLGEIRKFLETVNVPPSRYGLR